MTLLAGTAMLTTVLFMGCSDSDDDSKTDAPSVTATLSVDLNPLTVHFPATGGNSVCAVTTNQDSWKCHSDQTWCVADKVQGNQLSIKANSHMSTTAPEPAKVTVTAGNATPVEITVTQDAYVPPAVTSKAIYIVGSESIDEGSYAMLWKYQDGTVTRQQLSTNQNSKANSVFVSGTDVYVGGKDYHGGTGNDWGTGTVWKNGTAVQQEKPSSSINSGTVNSVRVIDNKVYAAGYYSPSFGAKRACVWVDGALNTKLLNTDKQTQAKFIGASTDGKIHVLGSQEVARTGGGTVEQIRYWVDGTLQEGYLPEKAIYPDGLWVEGNDVHIIGSAPAEGGNAKNISYYWKNGVRQTLEYSSVNSYSLYDIYVQGGDVYISANSYYWKNGTRYSTYPHMMCHFVVSADGAFYSTDNRPTLYVDDVPVVLTTNGGSVNDICIVE